jgi:heme oxygenase
MDASSRAPDTAPSLHRSNLRSRLKLETHALHRQAERSGIMQRLLLCRIDRAGYCALLRNLYEIYAPLENGLQRHSTHPQVQPIFSRALHRVSHLASDLRMLCGEAWSAEITPQAAAVAYRDRLNELAAAQPALLVAHAVVRYLDDLSGGQIVFRLVTEQLRLGEDATRFYQFGTPADIDQLLALLRNGLDVIPVSAPEEDAIVAEAQSAFRRHITLFEEIASGPTRAAG